MADVANLALLLTAQAAARPDALAVVVPDGRDASGERTYARLTFAALEAKVDRLVRGLAAHGLVPGMRAVLMVRPGVDFFALAYALLKAGVVPVLVDPGLGRAQLRQCLAEAKPEAFIGVPEAHAARIVLGWGRATVRHLVTAGRRWAWGGATVRSLEALGAGGPPVRVETAPTDTAAILFTSGSTGPAKGVVVQHRHLVAQVAMLRATYGLAPGEVDVPTFAPFALFDPALGLTAVVPEMDFSRPARVDVAMLGELVGDWHATNVFGSPAVLTAIARDGASDRARWSTVRRVLSAGAPVSSATLEAMHRVLDEGAEIFTPYGATECLPVASIGSRELLGEARGRTARGEGICVGRPVPPNDVRIIAIDDGALTDWADARELGPGEIGEITVLGPTTTEAYEARPEATRLAKIARGGRVVHRMGDVGYLDPEGRLWFCGRKSQRVALGDRTLFTAPVEEVFNAHPAVLRSALVGVRRAGAVVPVVLVERQPGATLDDETLIAELGALGARHSATRGLGEFAVHPAFPTDVRHNAKIAREQLAAWAEARRA